MEKIFNKDLLSVRVFESRAEMGQQAALYVAEKIKNLLLAQESAAIIFAAAPSQNEFLETLVAQPDIEWNRLTAFHMDEYIGLSDDAPQRFGNFLKDRLFAKVPFKNVFYMNGNAPDPKLECQRYAQLLDSYRPEMVCMGIGENTHIAFNDPHVADFNDPETVKIVDLDEKCRQQQVNDGCFASIDQVPTHALTLTIPTLLRPSIIACMVPGPNKADAVWLTLTQPVCSKYPSTALRNHPNAVLFVDNHSAAKIAE